MSTIDDIRGLKVKGILQVIYVSILGYRQTDERLPHKSFVFTFVSNAQ